MSTKIPYAQMNYETVGGCDKIKSGCKNCYAIPLIHRMNCCQKKQEGRYTGLVKDGKWTGKIKLFEDRVEQPLHRTIPTTYFVNSRSDTFHKDVPFEFIAKMLAVMAMCPQHTFMLFTKRWERCAEFYEWLKTDDGYVAMGGAINEYNEVDLHVINSLLSQPPPNVRLYFSASTQKEYHDAIEYLVPIPVAARGISFEPLVEEIDWYGDDGSWMYDFWQDILMDTCKGVGDYLHSIIVGCESGPNRRPCKTEWVRDIVRQCKEAVVPVYVKQLNINGKVVTDPKDFPEDLRIREILNG